MFGGEENCIMKVTLYTVAQDRYWSHRVRCRMRNSSAGLCKPFLEFFWNKRLLRCYQVPKLWSLMEIRGWSKQRSPVLFPFPCTSHSDSYTPAMPGACSGLKIVHRYRPCWESFWPRTVLGVPSRLCTPHRWVVIMAKHWKESEMIMVHLAPFPCLCALRA